MAHRALVQRLHPDRLIDASPGERALADRRIREVNESWNVLRDGDRRRAYDDGRLGTRSGAGGGRSPGSPIAPGRSEAPAKVDDDLVDVLPEMTTVQAGLFRHLPWVALVVVFAVMFVLTAYAGGTDDEPSTAPGAAPTGACLDVPSGTSTTIVSCDGPYQYVLVDRVAEGSTCPEGSEPRRLRSDGRFDCLAPA